LLDIARDIGLTGAQVALVLLGFRAVGLVAGFVIGLVGATLLALILVVPVTGLVPSLDQVKSLVSFAKFAYLDTLVGGEQIWLDVLLLGLFVGGAVSQGDIGIYGIAYSTSMFGFALSAAIGRAILPEISGFEASDDDGIRDRTVTESLRYAALLAFPLAFGALAVGDLVLRDVFGFGRGYLALVVLGFGAVAFSVYQPIHQTLYGLDRPSWAFGVSFVTSLLNAGLNILLIPRIGIVGTAISTAFSMVLALALGLILLRRAGLRVELPLRPWALQFGASVLMVAAVLTLRLQLPGDSRLVTVALVLIGGAVYGGVTVAGDARLRRRIGGQFDRFS
jgi:O-antigen/teichoic acid export membrane protein